MKNSLNPVATYSNPDLQKDKIYSENRQAGIYRWTNKINGKIYIGSSQNISKRFSQYSNPNYLKRNTSMPICRALLKYGYSGFSLEILEYCEPENVIKREQHYIDLLNPEYNILKIAGSMLGFRQSEESRAKMSAAAKKIDHPGRFKTGENNPMFGKARSAGAGKPSQAIEVTDISKGNTKTTFGSIHEAAAALNLSIQAISQYFIRNQIKPIKGRYVIRKI
jgi:hypothetical protein